uniref:Cleavage/polyadenylation specificity factor A subunit C-terminal domain-containing protein n=1 Tax=Strigamia maritima TaxID=126957 RepID=T1JE89_STRMM
MFAIHKQLHPPTGVEHAIFCHFFNRREKNLILSGANQLRVFKLYGNKMECSQTFELYGNIMSLQSVQLPESSRDYLLLSFRDAKLSIVEYDPETHDLKTISIHQFEEAEMKNGRKQISDIPEIRVDPQARCAVMSAYGNMIVFPFNNRSNNQQSSYTINPRKIEDGMNNIIDFQFLHGYFEPTLLFLYESSNTCSISAVSINLEHRVNPIIWSKSNLPFDCFRVLPVANPGGILLFAVNSLFYLNQSFEPYGVSLNGTTKTSSSMIIPLKIQENVQLSLDCCHMTFITDDRLLLSLKDGELHLLTLFFDNWRMMERFKFEKIASTVLATCLCVCENNFLFLGSRLGNSHLLRYSDEKSMRKSDEPPPRKKRKSGSSEITSTLKVEICDSLLNFGPCGQILPGGTQLLSEEFSNNDSNPHLELVAATGHGKNGALTVLQRSVKPRIISTFQLPDIVDMWTVQGPELDSYLILSSSDTTMILQTGQDIDELDDTGFNHQTSTIFVGNVGNGRYIVQVSSNSVYLLEGIREIQHISLDDVIIVRASLTDPHLMLMSDKGVLFHLTLRLNDGSPQLTLDKPRISRLKILNMCLYEDLSGLFITSVTNRNKVEKNDLNNDEAKLYGKSKCDRLLRTTVSNHRRNLEIPSSFWLVVVIEDGSLELYSLSDFKLVFRVRDFFTCPRVLVDSEEIVSVATHIPVAKELLLVGLGPGKRRPYLFSRVGEEILIYETFLFESVVENHLNLRFKKVSHSIVAREQRIANLFHYFEDISSYSGVFVSGSQPYWIFFTLHGELRTHPMFIDGSVVCFSSFHNINSPKGFLYINGKSELRVCALPDHLSYDAYWPVRKIPLHFTCHFVSYHVESKIYCVVTSTDEERFRIQLFSPLNWESISNTDFVLDESEFVTCLKNVNLSYPGSRSGFKEYITVGTNYNTGEDVANRGRIVILDMIEVVPIPGRPLTKNRLKSVYSKLQKGPVTTLCQVAGYLVSGIGQKLHVWSLVDEDLVPIAFIDSQVYIHTSVSVRNFILVADIYKSVTLLWFQEEHKKLSVVSRDVKPMEVYAIEFLIDNNRLEFLVSDSERNVVLFSFSPELKESCGGQLLVRKGDFHVGSCINSFFRISAKSSDDDDQRQLTVYGSLDGSVGYFLPVSEKLYRRLFMLQNVLVTHLAHTAGLNPKAFRIFKSRRSDVLKNQKNVLDGDLLWKYLHLSSGGKVEVSKRIGTTVGQILDDLVTIGTCASHF